MRTCSAEAGLIVADGKGFRDVQGQDHLSDLQYEK
jgi:hypothetical protein